MNIGILVYSQTGNTLAVGQKLQEALQEDGHCASLQRLQPTDQEDQSSGFRDDDISAVEGYDVLVFGSPVHAFSLPSAVTDYFHKLPSLSGKQAACFVTKQLPFRWTGGTQAVSRLRSLCESKDADVVGTEILIYRESGRDRDIDRCVKNFRRQFLR